MNKPVVKFTNVTKTYSMFKKRSDKLLEIFSLKKGEKSFSALSDVSFEVYKGETIGIIGINGSGKSTLSSLLAQVTPPTTGEVTIEGETSLVAISAGLNNSLTGMENIELKCMMHGLTKEKIKEITPAIVEFADIGEFIDQPIKSYSSGMKSRLGFAISAHIQPDILVIDEALSVGDSTFYKKCMDKFDEFKKQGKTIFFISHSMSQVKSISDRILWLNFGRIKRFGESNQISKEYNNFIKWFNDLNKQEQREYRKEMLTSQKSTNNLSNLRTMSRKKQKKRNLLPLLQFSFIGVMFMISTLLLFVDNPIEAINSTIRQSQETVKEDEGEASPVETNDPSVVEIHENGMINVRTTSLYKEELENVETELSFATEVFVEEEVGESIYKVTLDNEMQGYVEMNNVEIMAREDMTVSTLSLEDLLPVFSERVRESYAFFFAFLNTDYENIKSKLQGLTDEYEDSFGNQILVYEYGAYSYYFNEDDIAEAISIDNINVDSLILDEFIAESQINSNDNSLYYLMTDKYQIILDVQNQTLLFKIK